jgi:hypothetical protein
MVVLQGSDKKGINAIDDNGAYWGAIGTAVGGLVMGGWHGFKRWRQRDPDNEILRQIQVEVAEMRRAVTALAGQHDSFQRNMELRVSKLERNGRSHD